MHHRDGDSLVCAAWCTKQRATPGGGPTTLRYLTLGSSSRWHVASLGLGVEPNNPVGSCCQGAALFLGRQMEVVALELLGCCQAWCVLLEGSSLCRAHCGGSRWRRDGSLLCEGLVRCAAFWWRLFVWYRAGGAKHWPRLAATALFMMCAMAMACDLWCALFL